MATSAGASVQDTASKSPRWAVAAVFAAVFIDLLGFGIIIPILPFYVRSFGLNDVFIGLLAASYSLPHFLAIELTPWFIFQIALTLLAVAVWLRDCRPGLDRLVAPIHRRF